MDLIAFIHEFTHLFRGLNRKSEVKQDKVMLTNLYF